MLLADLGIPEGPSGARLQGPRASGGASWELKTTLLPLVLVQGCPWGRNSQQLPILADLGLAVRGVLRAS